MIEQAQLKAPATANLAQSTVRGTLWTYVAYYSGKLMVLVSTVILARLLSQDDFGVAGYAVTVVAFLDVLSTLGIGPALIYERDHPSAKDTAFWLGLFIGAALFAATWVMAPLIAFFFRDPRAIQVTRVLALTFPLSALSNVHDMLLRKTLSFRQKALPDFIRSLGKGVLSIVLALLGFGAWSLILGQVGGIAIAVVAFWKVMPWRPRRRLDPSFARLLLRYGLNIVSVDFLNVITANLDYVFIARFLGAAALGVYTLAFRIPELLILQFCNIISSVVFPVYTRLRDDPEALPRGFLVTTRYITLVTVPLGLGLALVTEPFVLTVFSAKWVDAIPVLRAISIYAMLLSFAYNAGDVYKAEGRPIILTWLTLVQGAVLIPTLYLAATVGGNIAAVGWTHAAVALFTAVVDTSVALRLMRTPLARFVETIRPAILCGATMSVVVVVVLALTWTFAPWLQLVTAVLAGAGIYLFSLKLAYPAVWQEALAMLHSTVRRRAL